MIEISTILIWLLKISVAFAATVAFAVIFHTPKKQYLFAGLTGAFGWFIYSISLYFSLDVIAASFLAAFALTWLARVISYVRKEIVTAFLICGIFPIVPGAGIYYAGYYVFMNENALASSKFLETLKIAIAIALGLGVVLSLPSFIFNIFNKKNKENKLQEKLEKLTGGDSS